jgi:hypothetical protein
VEGRWRLPKRAADAALTFTPRADSPGRVDPWSGSVPASSDEGGEHHIQSTECGERGYVPATLDYSGVAGRVELPSSRRRERGLKCLQGHREVSQVVWIGVRYDIEILRSPDKSLGPGGDAADDDEADVVLMQGLEQRAEVELGQRVWATPLIALICLQSAWTRASRSLIGMWQSASRRNALAC